ncbi:MAG: sodium:calcium antiporter [Burkholderiaceae bacterium]|nr:sodium:calcium antiporter [Burkholderiaceae bacterium]
MTAAVQVWAQFAACVAFIGVAGVRLARYGDAIASLTSMPRNWVGMVLMATVTSLPELVTGLSAVTIAATPDIAVGDALGSCVFNLAILAVVDLLHRRGSFYTHVSSVHVVSASLGIALLAVAGVGIMLSEHNTALAIGHVSLVSIVLIVLYGWAMRIVYRIEQGRQVDTAPAAMTLRQAVVGYAVAAIVIIAAGIWLPLVGVQLGRVMNWSDSFVGTLFIALATSVPELATTLGAVRIGAIDMALGNVLGSNLFDLLIIALDDLAYIKGPIFAHVSMANFASVVFAGLMNGVVILAVLRRPANRIVRTMSWAGIALAALFVLSATVQFLLSH